MATRSRKQKSNADGQAEAPEQAAGDDVFEAPDESEVVADVTETAGAGEDAADAAPEGEFVLEYGDGSADDDDEMPRFESVAHALSVLEAVLFSSNEPLSPRQISALMSELQPKCVMRLLEMVRDRQEAGGSGVQIIEIAGGFQLATRPDTAPWVFRLHRNKRRAALTPATLETVAIVAYKQPVTRAEIETIRGVESSAPLRTLQDLGLIDMGARREVPGRPPTYVTTEQFLKVFGLKSLEDLPSISELKQAFAARQEKPKAKPEPAPETPDMLAGAEPGTGDDAEDSGAQDIEPVDPAELTDEAADDETAGAETDDEDEDADEDDEDLEDDEDDEDDGGGDEFTDGDGGEPVRQN